MEPLIRDVRIKILVSGYNYFLPGSSKYNIADDMQMQAGFDFQTFENNRRYYHLFLEIFYPEAADMMYSILFELAIEDELIVETGLLKTLTNNLLTETYKTYRKKCAEANINIPDFNEPPELPDFIIEHYKKNIPEQINLEKQYRKAFEQVFITFPTSAQYHNFMRGTINVIDQLTMHNANVNREHNRMMLDNIITMTFPKFLTLRLKCDWAVDVATDFNVFETILLFQLADCAVQVLLSPMYDQISEKLTREGFNTDDIKNYIRICTKMRKELNESMKENGSDIDALNKVIDWPAILQ